MVKQKQDAGRIVNMVGGGAADRERTGRLHWR